MQALGRKLAFFEKSDKKKAEEVTSLKKEISNLKKERDKLRKESKKA